MLGDANREALHAARKRALRHSLDDEMKVVVLNRKVYDAKIRKAARRLRKGGYRRENESRPKRTKSTAHNDVQRLRGCVRCPFAMPHVATPFTRRTPSACATTATP